MEPLRYGKLDCDPIEASGLIRAMMPSNVRVLDVGCGVGALTEAVNADKNNTVLCIEPDPVRAEAARDRGLSVYVGLLDDDFIRTQGKFDVIVFADVLEHLTDPAAMLQKAVSCLAADGMIISSVPNVAHWTVRMRLLIGRFDYDKWGIMDATHLRWFTTRSMLALYDNQGLAVVDLRHSAGTMLDIYGRAPFRLAPRGLLRTVVATLTRWLPNLFGCQHVIKAKVRGGDPVAAA
jgi:methionine biosynthesis protein MetW